MKLAGIFVEIIRKEEQLDIRKPRTRIEKGRSENKV